MSDFRARLEGSTCKGSRCDVVLVHGFGDNRGVWSDAYADVGWPVVGLLLRKHADRAARQLSHEGRVCADIDLAVGDRGKIDGLRNV